MTVETPFYDSRDAQIGRLYNKT